MPDNPEATAVATVRLLINDTTSSPTTQMFSDAEIGSFLTLEGGVLKLAAAQAIDVIADNEALVSKVIRDSDGKSTDGAKVADALRKRATTLRAQHQADVDATDDGYFAVVDLLAADGEQYGPELTGW